MSQRSLWHGEGIPPVVMRGREDHEVGAAVESPEPIPEPRASLPVIIIEDGEGVGEEVASPRLRPRPNLAEAEERVRATEYLFSYK